MDLSVLDSEYKIGIDVDDTLVYNHNSKFITDYIMKNSDNKVFYIISNRDPRINGKTIKNEVLRDNPKLNFSVFTDVFIPTAELYDKRRYDNNLQREGKYTGKLYETTFGKTITEGELQFILFKPRVCIKYGITGMVDDKAKRFKWACDYIGANIKVVSSI